MQLPNYNSPSELQKILTINNLGMQKKFGQNFLINENARKKIAEAVKPKEGMKVWEVGAGLGAMTSLFLEKGVSLTSFEIDKGFIRLLKFFFQKYPHFNLVEGDVLKTWKLELDKTGLPDVFFGNLPYNIAAVLIAQTIEAGVQFDVMAVTIQKEVGDRMRAKPSTPLYSSFSVLCQFAYDIEPILNLPPNAFWPKPKVSSQALILKKKPFFETGKNHKPFTALVRSLFASRRKTLKNNLTVYLKSLNIEHDALCILKKAGFSPDIRAEVLKLDDFLHLYSIIAGLNAGTLKN